MSAMLAFIPRLLGVLYVEMLVHGNATAEEVSSSKRYSPEACMCLSDHDRSR